MKDTRVLLQSRLEYHLGIMLKDYPEACHYIKEYCSIGGKYVRPLLFLEAYRLYDGQITEQEVDCAVAIELLHDFFLIHDDIMDDDDLRRGEPTVHAFFAQIKGQVWGRGLALVFGDLIYTYALRLAKEQGGLPLLDIFLDTTMVTAEGQIKEFFTEDIPSQEDLVEYYKKKTAYYSIYFPLRAAAALRNRGDVLPQIQTFSEELGLAYQLYDDIIEVEGEKQRREGGRCGDIMRLKMTPILRRVIDVVSSTLKEVILEKYRTGEELTCEEENQVMQAIRDHGLVADAKKTVKDHVEQAGSMLKKIGLENSQIIAERIKAYTT